ncbi:GtrA family protein [Streptomyces purpureus]|uniref:Sugar transferase n=1 Tax=Streptomyces purpureus TaxID=1951 RepID=A0A918H3X7_9ACTN|nr:GtrA family protein [Streptomyces purpureus]GGT34955.1 sugar transferase [Streptomyces purpureus]
MRTRGQILRFALVGVVNTATYYALYLLLKNWLPYVAAHAAAFVLSMTGSFFLTTYVTYRTRPTWRKFLLFPLTNATNFVVTTAGVYLLVDLAGLSDRYAPLLAAAAAIPVTFLVSRTIMLRPETPRTRDSLDENSGFEVVAQATTTAYHRSPQGRPH